MMQSPPNDSFNPWQVPLRANIKVELLEIGNIRDIPLSLISRQDNRERKRAHQTRAALHP